MKEEFINYCLEQMAIRERIMSKAEAAETAARMEVEHQHKAMEQAQIQRKTFLHVLQSEGLDYQNDIRPRIDRILSAK